MGSVEVVDACDGWRLRVLLSEASYGQYVAWADRVDGCWRTSRIGRYWLFCPGWSKTHLVRLAMPLGWQKLQSSGRLFLLADVSDSFGLTSNSLGLIDASKIVDWLIATTHSGWPMLAVYLGHLVLASCRERKRFPECTLHLPRTTK